MTEIIDFLKQYYTTWGYLIVLVGAYLENTALLGLILPGGTLILLGALYAKLGYLSLPLVVVCGFVGMFLGSSTDFWIGWLGLHRVFERTRFWPRVEKNLEKGRAFMDKYGGWAIFFSHFVGHLRAFVALTAGMSHYRYRNFAMFDSIAALIWNIIYCTLGYLLADNIELIERIYGRVGIGLLIALVVAFIGWKIWQRYRERHRQSETADD
jgi:membrane protein DedA with SNARE-associated domain